MGSCESKTFCKGGQNDDLEVVVSEQTTLEAPIKEVTAEQPVAPKKTELCFDKDALFVEPNILPSLPKQTHQAIVSEPLISKHNVTYKLAFEVHGATLKRSFKNVGKMDPYAVVTVDGSKVLQTKPHVKGHKNPEWTEGRVVMETMPREMRVEVWRNNMLQKKVLCGSTTIPLSDDMGHLKHIKFSLRKRRRKDPFSRSKEDEQTGSVDLSLEAICNQPEIAASSQSTVATRDVPLGQELDKLVRVVDYACGTNTSPCSNAHTIVLENSGYFSNDEDGEEQDQQLNDAESRPSERSNPEPGFEPTVLIGSWKCVDTQNMEDFLIKSGIGMFQRKIALAAKWPTFEFIIDGRLIILNNHSAIGIIREEIALDQEYEWVDGKKNKFSSFSTWTSDSNGGVLLTKRTGVIGSYTEERRVVGDKLDLVINNPSLDASFSRSFVREPEK
eukprot:TRINITY_DN55839_c0_g1_i1.p1 TRINITY_DN55839_c0_g1~~TRINITY_DN55839_c0_g1_i1.p1  ORF type:complete len:444 (-),score=57.63 TRINITY_DN55839_c0_g1_i1:54-1385(-)